MRTEDIGRDRGSKGGREKGGDKLVKKRGEGRRGPQLKFLAKPLDVTDA